MGRDFRTCLKIMRLETLLAAIEGIVAAHQRIIRRVGAAIAPKHRNTRRNWMVVLVDDLKCERSHRLLVNALRYRQFAPRAADGLLKPDLSIFALVGDEGDLRIIR